MHTWPPLRGDIRAIHLPQGWLQNFINTFSSRKRSVNCHILAWKRDLGKELEQSDWDTMWESVHTCSCNIQTLENACKQLFRWYLTPVQLSKMNIALSPVCFRDCSAVGSFRHIWWDCSVVHKTCMKVYRGEIFQEPNFCRPFGSFTTQKPVGMRKTRRRLFSLILLATRQTIAQAWPPLPSHGGRYANVLLIQWHRSGWWLSRRTKLLDCARFGNRGGFPRHIRPRGNITITPYGHSVPESTHDTLGSWLSQRLPHPECTLIFLWFTPIYLYCTLPDLLGTEACHNFLTIFLPYTMCSCLFLFV